MKKHKIIYGCATLLACLTLAACGGGGSKNSSEEDKSIEVTKKGFPIVDKKLKMSLMAPGSGKNWSKMETLIDYAKKTNIDFSYTTPPLTDFPTKLNLAFASGDISDVIFGAGSQNLTRAQEVDYGSQGIIIPLEDLIPEYAPNLNKLLEERPDIRKSITAPDGHIYSLPMISDGDIASWPIGPLWYKGEWLKNLGVTELPKTIDDFYKLLVRFRDEDPNRNGKKDEIPLTEAKLEVIKTWLMPAFGIFNGGIQVKDGKVSYSLTSPEYKEFLTFMHKLYAEKLLDPEVYSQADEQKKAKGQSVESASSQTTILSLRQVRWLRKQSKIQCSILYPKQVRTSSHLFRPKFKQVLLLSPKTTSHQKRRYVGLIISIPKKDLNSSTKGQQGRYGSGKPMIKVKKLESLQIV